jgi:HAD superfamily hydrolase (TIGR01662 family)
MNAKALDQTKLIIFDVDGVIFDIIDAIRDTVKAGMEKYHLSMDFQTAMEEVSRVMELAQTMPIPQLVLNSKELLDIQLLAGMTVLRKLRIAASIYSDYRTRKEQCGLFPGIKDLITDLASRGYKLAILSNNKRTYVLEALAKDQLGEKFNQILGFNEVSKTKPNPEGIFKIMSLEQVTPEQTIFIGDMPTDIQAGKAAGVRTVAVSSGLSGRVRLESEKPTYIVENIQELTQLFSV